MPGEWWGEGRAHAVNGLRQTFLLHLHQQTATCPESDHKRLETSGLHVTFSTRSFNRIRFLEQQMQHIKSKMKTRLQRYTLQSQCKIQVYTQESTSVLDMNPNYCQLWATIMRPRKVSSMNRYRFIPPSAFKTSLISPPTPNHLDVLFTVPVVESDGYVMALLCAALLLATHNESGHRVGGGWEHTGTNIQGVIS